VEPVLQINQRANGSILIVEDNDAVRNSLYEWLSGAFPNCRFMKTKSGERAVGLVSIDPPNIVLMDVGLPQMNGIEATRRIKEKLPATEVVILTVYEDEAYQADAAAAGASAYILKRKIISDLVPELSRRLANVQG